MSYRLGNYIRRDSRYLLSSNRRRTIGVTIILTITLLIVISILYLYAKKAAENHTELIYTYNACSEEEVISSTNAYYSDNLESISNTVNMFLTRSDNQLDAKCNYIQILEFVKTKSKVGAESYIKKYNIAPDKLMVNKLIAREGGASIDELARLTRSFNSQTNNYDAASKSSGYIDMGEAKLDTK